MKFYRVFLLFLILLLVAALAACAGSNDKTARADSSSVPSGQWKESRPMRLLLAGSEARDSAAIITEFYIDQALRQAADSIAAADYLTINYRDSLATLAVKAGGEGIETAELAEKLNLDAVIHTRFARFSSVLGLDLRIIDPKSNRVIFRDVDFSMIRYRDTSGTMYLGPAVYDAVRKALGRFFGMPHTTSAPVATEPLVISGVVMEKDPKLGRLAVMRDQLAHDGVAALGEYARAGFPELVAFDITSRNEIFRTVNVGAVAEHRPMSDLERRALFNLAIDRYVTASVLPVEGDSAKIRVEIRSVVSPSQEALIDAEEQTVPVDMFATASIEEDFVRTLLETAQPLYAREAERVRTAYREQSDAASTAGDGR